MSHGFDFGFHTTAAVHVGDWRQDGACVALGCKKGFLLGLKAGICLNKGKIVDFQLLGEIERREREDGGGRGRAKGLGMRLASSHATKSFTKSAITEGVETEKVGRDVVAS